MGTAVDPVLGRCIGGDFDVVRMIAAGGVGTVYEAVQRSTGKLRAIKLMHAWLLRDERMRGRFIDEAKLASSIDSDHVVEVVSAGIDTELGVPWIAMELLRGLTLAEHVERYGSFSAAESYEVLAQARHGLQMAHARRLVHRDLKPENIFLAEARRLGVPFTIKVLDFGIAKWVHDARENDQNSQIIGTPSWMSPEQLSNATIITPATDVFALGLLAFWLLTGREYWLAANDERSTVSAVLLELVAGSRVPATERAVALGSATSLPPGFDAWFARATALDPTQRFVDAAACVDALAPVLSIVPANTTGSQAAAFARGVAPDTREFDAAFDRALAPRVAEGAPWTAHSATAAIDDAPAKRTTSASRTPRPTARRLDREDLRGDLFAGHPSARRFFPLVDLLAEGLVKPAVNPADASPNPGTTRPIPDLVNEAVRRVSLVLGVHPPAAVVHAHDDLASFAIDSLVPPVLGVGARLRATSSLETLRAHAAVGVGRTLPILVALALFESPAALDSARKAATALARGAVSSSPHFRRLVGQLGARRAELAEACELAEGVSAEVFWEAAILTLARLALLCSADRDASVEAVETLRLGVPGETVREDLDAFAASPSYESYWHRPSV